jgi:hypothetical protein
VAAVAETRPADMAPRRRTPVLRALAWLVCWLLEISSLDGVDHEALDAHIAVLAEQDREGGASLGPAGIEALDRRLDL